MHAFDLIALILDCSALCVCAGVVLGVVCHGGLLLTTDQLSAGQLMAFLVATQTIQRYNINEKSEFYHVT